jgi:hypothetical protein
MTSGSRVALRRKVGRFCERKETIAIVSRDVSDRFIGMRVVRLQLTDRTGREGAARCRDRIHEALASDGDAVLASPLANFRLNVRCG